MDYYRNQLFASLSMHKLWSSLEQSPLIARQRIRQRLRSEQDGEIRASDLQQAAIPRQTEGFGAAVKYIRQLLLVLVGLVVLAFGRFLAMKPAQEDVPDTDSSLIIVDVVENGNGEDEHVVDDYGRFHQLWIDMTEIPESTLQYGTSFADARSSRYTYARSLDRQYNRIFTENGTKFTANSDVLTPKLTRTAYDDFVSKFYLPQAPLKSQYSLVDTLVDTYLADEVSKIDTERQNRRHKITAERESLTSKIQPLSHDQLAQVTKFWLSPGSTLVRSQFQIDITARDLSTLSDGQWLNDNVIDFYFNLFTSGNVFGWTTHFYTTLKDRGYAGVARWAKRKKVDVTSKDLILVPINIMGTHWALAVVDNVRHQFKYYDSLSSHGNPQALQLLRQYMTAEAEKQKSSIDYSSYSVLASEKAPQQLNGYDCGVFMCTCAKFLANGYQLTYGQRDMKVIRRRMAYEIIQGSLLK